MTDHFSTGSRDAHFVWKKNGQKMANCVNEQTHMLSNGQVHLLSWVKDAVAQDSEYTCLLISESGSSSITVEGNGVSVGQWLFSDFKMSHRALKPKSPEAESPELSKPNGPAWLLISGN